MITLIGYNTNLRGYLIVVKNKHCNIKTHILNIWTLFVVQIDPLLSLNLIFWLECLCQLQVLLWLSLFLLVLFELSLGSGSVTRDSLLCSELSPLPLSGGGSGPHLPSPAIARHPDPSSQFWGLSCCWMSSWQLSCIFVAVYSHHFQLGIRVAISPKEQVRCDLDAGGKLHGFIICSLLMLLKQLVSAISVTWCCWEETSSSSFFLFFGNIPE